MTVLPYPIPMQLGAGGGALLAMASTDDQPTPFPIVVDSGTVLTSYDNGHGLAARNGNFTLYGVAASGAPLQRMLITDLQLFNAPLFPVGIGTTISPVRGVLAGDNLQRFAIALDYRGTAPTMTLLPAGVALCNCDLSQVQCQALFPFGLTGGQETGQQGQTRVVVGSDQFTYPPTRLLLDACIEPLADPLPSDCTLPNPPGFTGTCQTVLPPYLPSGVDVKMIVATGFPGVALSASAYDRLRGNGSAAAAFQGSTVTLHLPDSEDAANGAGVPAAAATIGATANLSPLAIVSHEFYFGPCASLARSRRMRFAYTVSNNTGCLLNQSQTCTSRDGVTTSRPEPIITACWQQTQNPSCNDDAVNSTVLPGVIELRRPLSVLVLADLTPLLVGINEDVRPTVPTVDGVIGAAVLQQLVSTIDYPGGRFFARCVGDSSQCVAYPRIATTNECSSCVLPSQASYNQLVACPVAQ